MTKNDDGETGGDEEPHDTLAELADSIKERREAEDASSSEPATTDEFEEPRDSPDEFIWEHTTEAAPSQETELDTPAFSALADATNVLVLAPLRGRASTSLCVESLTGLPADSVVYVTLMHSVENRLEATREFAVESPSRMAVIRVGSGDRPREKSTLSTADGPTELVVRGVDDPSDLTRLGIAITRCLSEWDDNRETAVCIHSLTELLQYVTQERLFRFVHILQAKLESAGAVAHFHMDPSSHSLETVSVFRPLFDCVLEIDADGSVTVTETDE